MEVVYVSARRSVVRKQHEGARGNQDKRHEWAVVVLVAQVHTARNHTGTRPRSTGSERRQNDRITREFLDEVAIVNPGYVQEERESSKKSRTQ